MGGHLTVPRGVDASINGFLPGQLELEVLAVGALVVRQTDGLSTAYFHGTCFVFKITSAEPSRVLLSQGLNLGTAREIGRSCLKDYLLFLIALGLFGLLILLLLALNLLLLLLFCGCLFLVVATNPVTKVFKHTLALDLVLGGAVVIHLQCDTLTSIL